MQWGYHSLAHLSNDKIATMEEDAYDEATYDGCHDALSDALQVGVPFDVNVQPDNIEGADFYLVKGKKARKIRLCQRMGQ